MDTLIFKNKCAEVFYDDELQLGKIIWNGNPSGDDYRAPFEKMLDYAKSHPTPLFLSDTINQGIVSPENRKWFEFDMLPRAIQGGLKKAAVISNANVFKRYYLNMILTSTGKFGLPVKVFSSQDDGIQWLKGK